jgi:Skp family chaperone for outer membrane proteins
MNPKVPSFASIVLIVYSCIATSVLNLYVITLSAVALANALARVAYLEAKLKTTSKALKEADAAKASADKAAKAAEARAIKAEKTLAEVSQKQAKREGGVVKRLNEIIASVGSKFFFLLLYSIALF